MKKWYKSKTIWFNIITGLLAVVSEVANVFPMENHPGLWVSVTTFGNLILRIISKCGIEKSAKKSPLKKAVARKKPIVRKKKID